MKLKALQDFELHSEVPGEVIAKYEGKIPGQFVEIWKDCGLWTFMQGYFKVINPDDCIEFVKEFTEDCIKPKNFKEALQRLGRPAYDECYGYVPLLSLGGAEKRGSGAPPSSRGARYCCLPLTVIVAMVGALPVAIWLSEPS